ncbi:MAG: hypothetical protein H8E31_13675 [Planctomycetes bacterium]|nr:hypothetical protein [Planctomycetota bacterium]
MDHWPHGVADWGLQVRTASGKGGEQEKGANQSHGFLAGIRHPDGRHQVLPRGTIFDSCDRPQTEGEAFPNGAEVLREDLGRTAEENAGLEARGVVAGLAGGPAEGAWRLSPEESTDREGSILEEE